LGVPHQNFIGFDDYKDPYALSVLSVPEETTDGVVRAILWRKNVSSFCLFEEGQKSKLKIKLRPH